MNKKQLAPSFSIFVIIAFSYAVFNFTWWSFCNPVIPYGGSALHFLDIFQKSFLLYNAPLLTYIMRFMFFIFGKEHYDLIVIIVNYVFFLIPLYFIYKIGTELKDKETGNIAMILFALVPAVYGMSRQYGDQNYHIIACITFNIYCLIKTDYFRNRKWSICYGISVGLGVLIKDFFIAYFFAPFLYIIISGLTDKFDKIKIINILFAVTIGILISCRHYFRFSIIEKILYEPITETVSIFNFESLRITTIGLWEELLSPPIFIIFVIGLIYFIWKYKGKYKNIILLCFFVPWFIIMLPANDKISEYGAGLIPSMILFGAVFLSCIVKKYIKKIILILLIIIGFLQYVDFSYGSAINLFNMQFKYKNNMIQYYNKNSPLISYNQKESKLVLNLMKYLKDNYHYNTFYIEEFCEIDSASIAAQMYLNNMYCIRGNYDTEDVLSSDIIIIIGKPKTIQKIVQLKINKMLKNNVNAKMITEEFTSGLINRIVNNFNEIRADYDIIDIFYVDQNQNNDSKVTLLGKKNKFLHFV